MDVEADTTQDKAANWLILRRRIVAVAKSSKTSHLKENHGAMGWRLNQEDADRLDKKCMV